MKSQLFILGLFAAFVIATEEKGAEDHTIDTKDCFNVSIKSECNTGSKVGYVRTKSISFDANHKQVIKCCKSKTGAHDEPKEKKEDEGGPDKEERRDKDDGNREASVSNFMRRSNRKMKRKLKTLN